ncbi:MAG: hypothetical protein ABUL67_02360 [Haliangium ochraceum]
MIVPIAATVVIGAGCAKVQETGGGSGSGSTPGTGTGGIRGVGGAGANTSPPPVGACSMNCLDLPSAPIIDATAPVNAPDMFSGTPPTSGGPCVVEPEDDTLFPNNWLRPRVKFTGAAGKLVKITITAPNQMNTLTAYTKSDTWTMPRDVWGSLRFHQTKDYVTVNVWVQGGGASVVRFRTAPVGAGGNLIFWAANPAAVDIDPHECWPPKTIEKCAGGSKLMGFSVGDERTIPVLEIPQVKQGSKADNGTPAPVICVGCHSGMPDNAYVSFIDHYPWRGVTASVQGGAATGAAYPSQTPGGLAALQLPGWGPFTYNKAAWAPGMKIGIAALGLATPTTVEYSDAPDKNKTPSLAWVNLESTKTGTMMGNWIVPSYTPNADITSGNAIGLIARMGDSAGAAFPNWSHDGKKIVYASTMGGKSARLDLGKTDLYTVDFNNGAGGTATPVTGAATTQFEEYYPAYSPDDKLIAFTRVPSGQVMYGNANAELAVMAMGNAEATPLRANRPPACTGKTSPGVNNHWPKWSPEITPGTEGTYYWIVFSSNRADIPPVKSQYGAMRTIPISQLYVAPVIMDESRIPQSYPAIYLWNQPADAVNTTPAWETFQIPPIE